jgi:hypothetical protein
VAVIGVKQIEKVTVTVQMERSVATAIDKCAARIHAGADHVINEPM